MRRFALALLISAATVIAAEPRSGHYALDRGSSDDVDQAIERTVKKMNFITRPIARSRLKKTNPAYSSITLNFTSSNAHITAGPGPEVVLPNSGAAVKWRRSDGETFTVTGKPQGGTYVETFAADDGRRTNTFSWDDAGRLTMNVTVTSPRLPAPLKYKLVYRPG